MKRCFVRYAVLLFAFMTVAGTRALPQASHRAKNTQAATGGFQVSCTLPFAAIATTPDPAADCGNCGVESKTEAAKGSTARPAFNQAKNNFCADASKVTVVTVQDLRNMQAKTNANGLDQAPNRNQLHAFFPVGGHKIGEGDVVRLKAWIREAHISDCPTGEEVNCDIPGFTHNDIHIPLVDPTSSSGRNQDECSSVTAEMSPHFRPATWSNLDMKTPVKNVVRVTGPLFFDNAHKPCAGLVTAKGDEAPLRSSLWEIHPVYQFEVCTNTDASGCDINSNDANMWVAYDQWVANPHNSAAFQPTGEKERNEESCAKPAAQKTGVVAAKCPTSSSGATSHRGHN